MKVLLTIFICALFLTYLSERASTYKLDVYGGKEYIRKESVLYFSMALIAAAFVGLRIYGNDTATYRDMYEGLETGWRAISAINWTDLADAPGFTFINVLLKTAGTSTQTFLMVYALFTVITYLWFIRKYSCNIFFSVFLFFTMGIYTFTMAAIKQTAAVAFLVIATDRAIRKKYGAFLIFVLIAELFHPYAFVYLIVPFLAFTPWTGKTYLLLVFTAVAAFGLKYFLGSILSFTEAIGGGYDETSFVGEGVNIFRVLVVWVPALLSFIARRQIRSDQNRTTNIIMNLSMVNAMIMFIGLFGTANYFGRLANYFLIFQAISLPWVLKYFAAGSRRFLTVCAVVGYLGYSYYDTNIVYGAFDSTFRFMTLKEFLFQLVGIRG